ncbi:MAG: hypothetical protein ABII93_03990 [Chrysiogenia bacterium]
MNKQNIGKCDACDMQSGHIFQLKETTVYLKWDFYRTAWWYVFLGWFAFQTRSGKIPLQDIRLNVCRDCVGNYLRKQPILFFSILGLINLSFIILFAVYDKNFPYLIIGLILFISVLLGILWRSERKKAIIKWDQLPDKERTSFIEQHPFMLNFFYSQSLKRKISKDLEFQQLIESRMAALNHSDKIKKNITFSLVRTTPEGSDKNIRGVGRALTQFFK